MERSRTHDPRGGNNRSPQIRIRAHGSLRRNGVARPVRCGWGLSGPLFVRLVVKWGVKLGGVGECSRDPAWGMCRGDISPCAVCCCAVCCGGGAALIILMVRCVPGVIGACVCGRLAAVSSGWVDFARLKTCAGIPGREPPGRWNQVTRGRQWQVGDAVGGGMSALPQIQFSEERYFFVECGFSAVCSVLCSARGLGPKPPQADVFPFHDRAASECRDVLCGEGTPPCAET